MLKKLFLSLLALVSFSLAAQALPAKKAFYSLDQKLNKAVEQANKEAALKHAEAEKNTEQASTEKEQEKEELVTCPECGKKLPVGAKCSNHHKPITMYPAPKHSSSQEGADSTQVTRKYPIVSTKIVSSGPICPDCGRTPEQVAISGHNHK